MSGFLFALIASIVVGIGARDQALIAALCERQGARPAVLVLAILSACASASAATWAGVQVTPMLVPAAKTMLVAMVLAVAALELLFIRPLRSPAEPTESLFAVGAVLAQQLTDASRFVIFALAAASQLPAATALGGAIGGSATVLAGWLLAGELRRWPLAMIRRALGVAMLALAAWLAF
jgi:hypothetical protein